MRIRRAVAAVYVCLVAGPWVLHCGPPSPASRGALGRPEEGPLLRDVTRRVGLEFTHHSGVGGRYFMPEIMGPGCALLDYDNDGDLDAYLVNGAGGPSPAGAPRNRLFRHEVDHGFVDVTDRSGLGDTGFGQGVAVGDLDNDGFVDVYVTNHGGNVLYRNRGDGTFDDVTARSGVAGAEWSTSATFLDYDLDGWLDLYVANYMNVDPQVVCRDSAGAADYCAPGRFPAEGDRLYHNQGDGTFEDVTESSGVGSVAFYGLGVVCADLTDDGLVDIYVANDMHPNLLWVNLGDGTFHDDALMMGVAFNDVGQAESGMGVIVADLDGDVDLDLFLTHLGGETNTAYANRGQGSFEDSTATMGLLASSVRFTGFGVAHLDLEHDGDLDLAIVNGHVFRRRPEPGADLGEYWNDYAQPGQLLVNDGGGRFTDRSDHSGRFGSVPQVGRGLAVGDLDHDGDLDLLTTSTGAAARVFYNDAPRSGAWLQVRVFDPALQRDAIGARVEVLAQDRRWTGTVTPGRGYLSSSDPLLHFGLGPVSRVDEIRVVWPGGRAEVFVGMPVDRRVTLARGEGRARAVAP